MYGETVPILNLCTALRYMYSKLGIDDFGLNDICDPSMYLIVNRRVFARGTRSKQFTK